MVKRKRSSDNFIRFDGVADDIPPMDVNDQLKVLRYAIEQKDGRLAMDMFARLTALTACPISNASRGEIGVDDYLRILKAALEQKDGKLALDMFINAMRIGGCSFPKEDSNVE